jgi:hypothetical protein
VKLGQYRGNTCLETFLANFENLSGYLHWNEAYRLLHLRAYLEGPAGQILWDAGPQTSVDNMIRLLRAKFGTDHQAERFREELRGRRRKKDESLYSLYNDICRLMAFGVSWAIKYDDTDGCARFILGCWIITVCACEFSSTNLRRSMMR